MKSESSIDKFAIAVAIGSILGLGAFLIADSFAPGFSNTLEEFSKDHVWGVIAIPAITFSYIVGAFMMIIADNLFQTIAPKIYEEEWRLVGLLAAAKNEFLTRQFEDLMRTKRILQGSVIPLLVLGIGIASEIHKLPSLTRLLIVLSVGVLLLASASPFFAGRIGISFRRLATLAHDQAAA
jgi:hypothetical protein